jgi:putative heme iron utilization protein
MTDKFTSEISDRICNHMNEDHADAVLLYAKAFAGTQTATAAQMLKIDPEGMDLQVEAPGSETAVRVRFDHELKDAEDAHHTLIEMVKRARQQTNS